MMYQVLALVIYLSGCVLSFGRAVRLSNNFKYLKIEWYTILWVTAISWIGLIVILRREITLLPNALKGKQPRLQFSLMQRFSNGERIRDEY